MEVLRVGKRLEQQGTSIFIDFWPLVLSFCGRGWFEVNDSKPAGIEENPQKMDIGGEDEMSAAELDFLSLPQFGP